jgi:hypothetical protein
MVNSLCNSKFLLNALIGDTQLPIKVSTLESTDTFTLEESDNFKSKCESIVLTHTDTTLFSRTDVP